MGYPLSLAVRYMGSKKRGFVSAGTGFAILGVALGVAALVTVMSVTGGFQAQFRDKVLGVNAHVLVLKYSLSFREYRDVMKKVKDVPGVTGVAPFTINPMMVTKGPRTATGVLLKGVDPEAMPQVLDLPKHLMPGGSLDGLRRPDSKPPETPHDPIFDLPSHTKVTNDPTIHSEAEGVDGGKLSLLDAIQKQVDEEALHPDASVEAITPPAPTDEEIVPDAGANGLVGNVTPDGGFASELPEDDVIP
ncbi:MAG TPA: ABC transporter permease, partial [Polyangiaceae bacterium]